MEVLDLFLCLDQVVRVNPGKRSARVRAFFRERGGHSRMLASVSHQRRTPSMAFL